MYATKKEKHQADETEPPHNREEHSSEGWVKQSPRLSTRCDQQKSKQAKKSKPTKRSKPTEMKEKSKPTNKKEQQMSKPQTKKAIQKQPNRTHTCIHKITEQRNNAIKPTKPPVTEMTKTNQTTKDRKKMQVQK